MRKNYVFYKIHSMQNSSTSILVIDEHPMMRESLCAAINAESDLKTVETNSFDEDAIQIIVSARHDVLFLEQKPDIILFALGSSGWGDLLALKNLHNNLLGTPILVLTSDEISGKEVKRFGAYAALNKTVSRNKLLETLRSIH